MLDTGVCWGESPLSGAETPSQADARWPCSAFSGAPLDAFFLAFGFFFTFDGRHDPDLQVGFDILMQANLDGVESKLFQHAVDKR